MTALVTLVSRPGCHLCDDARVVVEQVCGEVGQEWVEIDIDSDSTMRAEYWDRIPVVLLDGVPWDFWRVDAERLRSTLTSTR